MLAAIEIILRGNLQDQLEQEQEIPATLVEDVAATKRQAPSTTHEVHDILFKKRRKGKNQYLVKWQAGDETWEPYTNIKHLLPGAWTFNNSKFFSLTLISDEY